MLVSPGCVCRLALTPIYLAHTSVRACAEAALGIGRTVVAVEADEALCKAIEARLLRLVGAEG